MLKNGNKLKPWHGTQKYQLQIMIASLVLFFVVSIMFFHNNGERPTSLFQPLKQKGNSFETSVQFHPTVEFRNGTDLIWQIPELPKAVLFLAHGCNGRAVNFWDKSPNCPNCVGLPEERQIVLHALDRKYAVLTISSAGRCWTFGEERIIVKDIIKWWVEKHKLEKLHLVALGASSGGHFVSILATDLRFSSISLMIAEGKFEQMDVKEDYPPTLFVHMPRDQYRQQKIDENMKLLSSKGIDVAQIQCMKFPLSPNLLADRIPDLDLIVSAKLFELFRNKGFIDENGYMKADGRKTRWQEALGKNKALLLHQHLVKHVQEELNLAFAYHEMTSLQSEQIFKWFESHMN